MTLATHHTASASADGGIHARALVKRYPGGVSALDGVDLDVAPGTVVGLLGPNGAGKSTTVRILTTLSRPTSGQATVAGHDVVSQPDRVRTAIGVVGQRSATDDDATGRENLVLQAQMFGMTGRALRLRTTELLEQLDLAEAADRFVRTWSGGMRRKLDVAMGLVNTPRVLFLDEPTTGLDPDARAILWSMVEKLRGDGLAILLTTHYLDEADRLADDLVIVDHGRIVAEGTPDALKAELRGDAIHIVLTGSDHVPAAVDVLASLDGLERPLVDGIRITVRADRAAARVPSVLSALDAAGTPVSALTVARPSLDDVYLAHTGRAYDAGNMETTR